MTNPLKGQITIKLGGTDYQCRLTVDSIIKIEEELDNGILKITQRISDADIRMKEMSVILLYALRGGGNNFQAKDVNKIIQSTGLINCSAAVANLLVATLNDDSGESDEKKEMATA